MSSLPLERQLAEAWPAVRWQDVTVLVAVSGGADSVALARALSALHTSGAGRLILAHCHHGLRPQAADADRAFVEGLGQTLGLPVEVYLANLAQHAEGIGLETAAREARYRFFESAAARLGARYVVTAHTRDDQAETILHRVLRGTGPSGLAGVPQTRLLSPATTLVRPLLGVSRQEVLAYLQTLGQTYCEDETNADTRFTRNRIRHRLLPWLREEFNPNVDEALLRLGQLTAEAQTVVQDVVEGLLENAVELMPDRSVRIRLLAVADERPFVVRQLLISVWRRQRWPEQAMGHEQWHQLASLLNPDQAIAKQQFPGGVMATRQSGWLLLQPLDF